MRSSGPRSESRALVEAPRRAGQSHSSTRRHRCPPPPPGAEEPPRALTPPPRARRRMEEAYEAALASVGGLEVAKPKAVYDAMTAGGAWPDVTLQVSSFFFTPGQRAIWGVRTPAAADSSARAGLRAELMPGPRLRAAARGRRRLAARLTRPAARRPLAAERQGKPAGAGRSRLPCIALPQPGSRLLPPHPQALCSAPCLAARLPQPARQHAPPSLLPHPLPLRQWHLLAQRRREERLRESGAPEQAILKWTGRRVGPAAFFAQFSKGGWAFIRDGIAASLRMQLALHV